MVEFAEPPDSQQSSFFKRRGSSRHSQKADISNQITITGTLQNVEDARERIRVSL